jgi:hypothetical protein
MACLRVLALLILSFVGAEAAAQGQPEPRRWLHLNGYTHHFSAKPDANDNLLGIGLTWGERRNGRLAAAWETDLFRDSGRKLSAYLGQSLTYRFNHFSVGVTGAIMHHQNFEKYNRWGVLPVGLPFLETRGQRLKFRAYYIPPLRSASDNQIAIQLLAAWR